MENYKYKCDNCHTTIYTCYNGDKSQYYFFCKTCMTNLQICSKSKIKKLFYLNDNDLNNSKHVYLNNNKYVFYIYNDIKKIIQQKYGSFENFEKLRIKKKQKKQEKLNKLSSDIQKREQMLKEELTLNKLEYSLTPDNYSYIHYGKPDLKNIISIEIEKVNSKNKRMAELAKELDKINIEVDETLKPCYDYINNITYKKLSEIVKEIEIEHFFKHETNYLELCKIYSEKKAKELAINSYLNSKNNKNKKNNIKKHIEKQASMKINFD